MIDESGPKQEISFEDAVRSALSKSGIGDTSNNFNGLRMMLDIPEFWPRVKPVNTYEGYIRHKYERRPDLADAVVAQTDPSFVADYDGAMRKINEAIGAGITNEEQATETQRLCEEARQVVAKFTQSLG